ncbi:GIY-YIG nuclease family protein [Moheibacter sediminis]|uniref:Putative endonuclease n=1 Tax=Moheibacter sediminis TaxID=1434700 RepID=A0A1W1ZCS3_9FLAO|nr:GIY-YIG nuclease family protein [Moheibacter sediminis]SMC46235.1 putative endonuclease [Moheibacter sediminis]
MQLSYVYILTNQYRTTFYIGVTSNLKKRIIQHKEKKGSIFTSKYNLDILVYYEEHLYITLAIQREKQLKNWKREWKKNLIRQQNPTFAELEI